MKGLHNLNPPRPRYTHTWDVSIVLRLLKSYSPNESLSLETLTFKLVMLVALVTGQRSQSLSLLDTREATVTQSTVSFHITQPTKTSKPGSKPHAVTLTAYPADEQLCVRSVLREYLKRTRKFRKDNPFLFISTRSPHRNVTSQTISRWLKKVLQVAGVDTSIFKAHSTRSASASAAFRQGVSTDVLMSTVGWSSEKTFARFYNKPLSSDKDTYSNAILSIVNRI